MSRTQAHLEKVVKVYPIEGADKVEMCQILDYHVVVQKSHAFKSGDLVVYIEVDSKVPDGMPREKMLELRALKKKLNETSKMDRAPIQAEIDKVLETNTIPEFEFLRAKHFEINTMKFGKLGVFSLGIIFPLSLLDSFKARLPEDSPLKTIIPKEGLDVTELLGVTKQDDEGDDATALENVYSALEKRLMRFSWYRQIIKKVKKFLALQAKGIWPDFLPPQSDEDNVQKIFTCLQSQVVGKRLIKTEKLEGQNIAFFAKEVPFLKFWKRKLVGVCSHHRYIRSPDGSGFWESVKRLGYHKKIKEIPGNWFVRGEHCGLGVAAGVKNIYDFEDRKIFVFEVWNLDTKTILGHEATKAFCEEHGFTMVPVLDENYILPETVQEVLDASDGESVLGVKPKREGEIIRDEDYHISLKVRNPVYMELHSKSKKIPKEIEN